MKNASLIFKYIFSFNTTYQRQVERFCNTIIVCFRRVMAQYQLLYSGSEGPVLTAHRIGLSIPEYSPEPLLPSQHNTMKTVVPSKIDYSRFINEISSRRRPAQLREISNYSKLLQYNICVKCETDTTVNLESWLFSGKALEKLPSTCIKFGIGVPNVLTFPFKKITVELITGENIELKDQELSDALQYLASVGYV